MHKQGNPRAVNVRFCGFTNKYSGAVIKTDVIISKVHSSYGVKSLPWKWRFQNIGR